MINEKALKVQATFRNYLSEAEAKRVSLYIEDVKFSDTRTKVREFIEIHDIFLKLPASERNTMKLLTYLEGIKEERINKRADTEAQFTSLNFDMKVQLIGLKFTFNQWMFILLILQSMTTIGITLALLKK